MRRDYPANNKIGTFYAPLQPHLGNFVYRAAGAGAYLSTVIDHAAGRAGRVHGYEWSTVMMGLLDIVDWGAPATTGTLTITIQHSADNVTWATYATVAAVTGAPTGLYIFEVRDFRRYVRLSTVVGNEAVNFHCYGIFDRSRGEPVYQSLATELAVTVTGTP